MSKLKNINMKKVFVIGVISLLVVCIAGAGVLGYSIYKDTAVFDADKLLSSGASQIFDSNNELLHTVGNDTDGKRQNVEYDDIPQVLIDAVVAAEDSRFFEHSGFDLPRIFKAALSNLKAGGIRSGGSTITQQLIKKTYFPEAQRTYTRKISEIFLAMEADKTLSKEEIITLYLNKIYFGRTTESIGIGSACKYYFNKDVSEITLPEAALLAGSLNSPYNYDPYYNLNKATQRRNTILKLMLQHGYINEEEYELAKATKVENMLHYPQSSTSNSYSVYVDAVIDEVKERTGYDPKTVQMNIYTYCDKETQKLCTDLGNGVGYNYSDPDMQMGGAVQQSQNGRVVALIGGRNYKPENFDYSSAKQQPGSSVKPFFDYGLAFENLDWSTAHSIEDAEFNAGGYSPRNWDRQYHGMVTVENALENSWNIPAVKTFQEVYKKIGDKGTIEAMESIGIDMTGEEISLAHAIGGWSKGISPREMASAYATISNNGFYTESHTINYIEIVQTGEIIKVDEEIQDQAKQSAYSPEAAYMVRDVMTSYAKRGSGSYAYVSGISNIGAKTGTSNWPANKGNGMGGKSRDIWMSGYTNDYVCSVWMGFGQEGIQKGKTTSGYKAYPGQVVGKILRTLQSKGSTRKYPDKPASLSTATIMKGIYPYVLPGEGVAPELTVTGLFKKGTIPSSSFDPSTVKLTNLSSFSATVTASNRIEVAFAGYNPPQATSDEKFDTSTKMFGKVIYTVVIQDKNGAEVHKQIMNTPTGSINFTVDDGMKAIGYYSYEKAPMITSNKMEVLLSNPHAIKDINFTVSSHSGNIENNGTTTDTSINVNVTPNNQANKCTITFIDDSYKVISQTNGNKAHANLTPGHSYTVRVVEYNNSARLEKTLTFKIAGSEPVAQSEE